MADVCRAAGCALVGGETAELPGIYRDDELDFAGTCVGIVERASLIDGSRVEAGDLVIGFPSAGVHANGFTLVRSVLEHEDYEGDDLLAPTRLYLEDVRALRQRTDVRALAHVTGGGLLAATSRACSQTACARGSTGTRGGGRRCSVARATRRRGRAPAGLQPRHRLLRRRAEPGDALVIGRIERA